MCRLSLHLSIFLLLASPALSQAQKDTPPRANAPELWGPLQPGKYAIGFRVIYLADSSRPTAMEEGSVPAPRPIRVLMWYPTLAVKSGQAMVFRGYVEHETAQSEFAAYDAFLRQRDMRTLGRQFTQSNAAELAQRLLDMPLRARLGATAARGAFPLVMHSLGRNDYQQESTVLWEYLASHGFVVATIPQMGRDLKASGISFTLEDIEIQKRDLEFAITELSKLQFVNPREIAILGHSSGGVVAALAAANNPAVRAVVSLDGSLATTDGVKLMQPVSFPYDKFRASFLNLHRLSNAASLDAGFLNRLPKTRLHLGFPAAVHFDFQNWPVYSLFTSEEDPRSKAFRPAEAGRRIYWAVCEYVQLFLTGEFRGDAQARGKLTNPIHGLREDELQISRGEWKLTPPVAGAPK